MKVYTEVGSFQSVKVLLAAKLTGQKFEKREDKSDATGFLKSRLPVLEIEEGRFLFSPNTAAKYLFLKANKVTDEDEENQILEWELTELLPQVVGHLASSFGHEKKGVKVSDGLVHVLQEADGKVSKSKFIFGDEITVSDVCVFSTIFPLLELRSQDIPENLTNLNRWVNDIKSNQTVYAVLAEFLGDKGPEVFKASILQAQTSLPVQAAATPDKSEKPSVVTRSNSNLGYASAGDQPVTEKVSQEEITATLAAWKTDPKNFPKPRKREHPILPEENSRNIMVSSALPYVNNVPHLGNIIGCVLSADVYSRFARLRNYNVLYICGTDEYGTATETKALEEGVSPKEICDKYNKLHTKIYKWFEIDFDYFGRTTTEQQTAIAQDIFWKLHKEGYILKDSVDQLYCTKCEKFLADRFVEGTCPMCGFDDARGDQCDGCGKLINAVELKNPKCKICKGPPVIRNSHHLFVDLPKLEPKLKTHLDKVFETGTWTHNARVITNSWIRDGLKPRCISRDLKWGTPIPLEGYTDKVFYVWYDAPIGYISITANYTKNWQKWWKNPGKVEYYNFLGKDNVPFHSVIFPACLLGTNDGYTVVNNMLATEYLNYEDTKFSKSRNTGVFGDQAEDTGIKADIYRFYLLYVRPESQDTAFSWDDFQLKNNGELLNNLGNFVNRALTFLNNNFGGVVQEIELTEDDFHLLALVTRELKSYIHNLEHCKLRDGIRNILTISRLGNQYMQANKPWVLAKGTPQERKRAGSVVSLSANLSCLLSVVLQPYMPATSSIIQQQLQAPSSVNVLTEVFYELLQPGHKIGAVSPLFEKIENSTIADLKSRFAGKPQENVPAKGLKSKDKKAAKPEAHSKEKAGAQKDAVHNEKPEGLVNGALASPGDVAALTQAVTDQGLKVRDLKASKSEKTLIDTEVAILLQLKHELAIAQGENPDAAAKGNKRNKKK